MQQPLILNRYRPIETVGTGATGQCDICWDTNLQRRVAIKRMPLADRGQDGTIPGLSEARTAALLNHPNVVSVIDFSSADDEAYLIMEAMEGPTLEELLDSLGDEVPSIDIVADVAKTVGEVLDFAHENQVLHLDIKPANVMIGKNGSIKVSDFGISELADAQGFAPACGGTIGYMPPEQIRGLDLDQRCDEFALAMVVYESLTGENPFWADTVDRSLMKITRFKVDPPSSFRDDVDEELDEVLLCAMSPDRDDRYETVLEFLDELLPLLGDPQLGAQQLRELTGGDEEEEEARREEDYSHVGLWDRFTPRTRSVAGRCLGAILCWWIAAVGIVSSDLTTTALSMVIALVAAVVAAIVPSIGALFSLILLGVGFIIGPSIPIPLGIIIVLLAVIWWLFFGRHRTADVNTSFIASPLTLINMTPFQPLIAGFFLPLRRVCGAAIIGILLSMTALITFPALFSGTDWVGHELTVVFYGFSLDVGTVQNSGDIMQFLLTSPSFWVLAAGWLLSAIVMSLFCSRQSQPWAIIGVVAGFVLSLIAQIVAQWAFVGMWTHPGFFCVLYDVLAAFIMIIICVLGAPSREEGE